jgi:pimeloyl-ACP methyl ester carboxylesterase
LYHRSTINVSGGTLFYRHTQIDSQRPTLLCIHGLGDSGQAFLEAFREADLQAYNIIVPDLLGYGKSSRASDDDYCFYRQITRLYQLLDGLGIMEFDLIGHSMGGDIGTLMCANDEQGRIQAFANIEGDLTQGDRFITNQALAAEKTIGFEFWLRHRFTNEIAPYILKNFVRTCRRYQASLRLCQTYAFLQNAKEIYALNENHPPHDHGIIASIFDSLPKRKKYYWACESLSRQSQKYLENKSYSHTPAFEDSSHWVMLDSREKFYDALSKFLKVELGV